MILGIGTDLAQIQRFASPLARHGERFAARILSTEELDIWRAGGCTPRYLAKRFAAKEALAKALGTGLRGVVGLRNISVRNDALGKPEFVFAAALAAHLDRIGVAHCHLSLSDEQELALAFVVLEGKHSAG